jgi:iron complex outermembrane receptor protein
MKDLIDFENGSYTNYNADARGLELALEGKWSNGISTRVSYTLQNTRDLATSGGLPASPQQMVKFNGSVPVFKDKIFAGLEIQYTSKEHTTYTDLSGDTLTGADAPGYAVVNLTLFSRNLVKNLEVSASVYDLLNETYYNPSSLFHQQALIQQDGRTFRLKASYRF